MIHAVDQGHDDLYLVKQFVIRLRLSECCAELSL